MLGEIWTGQSFRRLRSVSSAGYTEGEILGFHNAVVALCLLLPDDFGQLPLDAFKLIRTQRDCPGKGFPQGGQIHEGKLELDGAVEIIEEVAPAVEDGLLVLVVRELVVDVPELDSFGEMGGRDLTDPVYTNLQVGNTVLCGQFLLICPICSCDCGLYLFLLSAGQLSLGGQSDIPPYLTGFAVP